MSANNRAPVRTTIIGDPQEFAIEYDLQVAWPPFGRVRLWADARWFGDIHREMYLFHMASMLQRLAERKPDRLRLIYGTPEDVPPDHSLLAGNSWSWGDSFYDFLFVLYAVESERRVHIVWSLVEERAVDFPGYVLGLNHSSVTYSVFDGVVEQFLSAVGISE